MKASLRSLCLAVAILVLAAPVAAAEIQLPHEETTIVFRADNGFIVYAKLHPLERVAVFGAQVSPAGIGGGELSSTSYAIHAPARAFGDRIDVDFGSLGKIDGRFVSDAAPRVGHVNRFCRGRGPISESAHFEGTIVFRGDGGFLSARSHRVDYVSVHRTFRLRCQKGHAADFDNRLPGLFGYVQPSTEYLSNSDGTHLRSRARNQHGVTEFVALDHLIETDTSSFKAMAREWLPGKVATTRSVEVEDAPAEAFQLAGPDRRPQTAAVRPPPPFSGEAEYDRISGTLSGDLTVSFLGKELPLTGSFSKTEICARPQLDDRWNCE